MDKGSTMTITIAKWQQAAKKSKHVNVPNTVNQGYKKTVPHKVFTCNQQDFQYKRSECFNYWKDINYQVSFYINKQLFAELLGDTFEVNVSHNGQTFTATFKRMQLGNRVCEKTGQPKLVWVCKERKEMYVPFLKTIRKPKVS